MGNVFGEFFKIMSWGESHGKAMGVVIDGCPSKVPLKEEDIQKDLDRRRPNQSDITSNRKEEDKVQILSGVFEGYTLGTPISLLIPNKDQKSEDYDNLKGVFRPGHADYSYYQKYDYYDYRGGGRSSARETVSRVAAGAVAKKILEKLNLNVYVYTLSVADIKAEKIVFSDIEKNDLRTPDKDAFKKMKERILEAKEEGTSLGGIVEACILNMPKGLGDPVFNKLDAKLSQAIMSIGAIKGIEFGAGFEHQFMKGHESNDTWIKSDNTIKTKTNFSGGILGGISTGMPIIMRAVVKAPSSISIEQSTVNYLKEEKTIQIKGRHDPCILPRVISVIEAMIYLVLCDLYLSQKIYKLY